MTSSNDPSAIREAQKNPVRNVAVAGLLDESGKILLVRTKRLPNHWQPIGGGVKQHDASPFHTVKREVEEETSLQLDLDRFEHVLTVDYDFGEGNVYFYICNVSSRDSLRMNDEIEAWYWFTLAEALNLQSFPATTKFIRFLTDRST